MTQRAGAPTEPRESGGSEGLSEPIAGDREQRRGDEAEGTHAGDRRCRLVGEHGDGRATDAVGTGEVDHLPDDRLTASEAAAIELVGELFQIEGDGAHGSRVRIEKNHEKR